MDIHINYCNDRLYGSDAIIKNVPVSGYTTNMYKLFIIYAQHELIPRKSMLLMFEDELLSASWSLQHAVTWN